MRKIKSHFSKIFLQPLRIKFTQNISRTDWWEKFCNVFWYGNSNSTNSINGTGNVLTLKRSGSEMLSNEMNWIPLPDQMKMRNWDGKTEMQQFILVSIVEGSHASKIYFFYFGGLYFSRIMNQSYFCFGQFEFSFPFSQFSILGHVCINLLFTFVFKWGGSQLDEISLC